MTTLMLYGFCDGCWNARMGGKHHCSGDACRCTCKTNLRDAAASDADARALFVEVHARLGHASYTAAEWDKCPGRDAAWRVISQILRERLSAPRRVRDVEDDARELFAEVHRRLGDAIVWKSSDYTHDAWRTIARVFAEHVVRAPIEEAQLDAEAKAICHEAHERCGRPVSPKAQPGPIWREVAHIVSERARAGSVLTPEQQDRQARGLGELALACDEFMRFVAGLPVQDLPIKDQRELRERIYAMKKRLGR